jgi:transcriptional regulator with XRE-family HTH domain
MESLLARQVGEAIMSEREKRGIARRQLAAMAGFTVQGLWKIETGKSDTPVSSLEKIALALRVSPTALLAVPDDPISDIDRDMMVGWLLGPWVHDIDSSGHAIFSGTLEPSDGRPDLRTAGSELGLRLQFFRRQA